MCRGAASRQQVRRGSSGVAGSVRTRFSFWMSASGALRFACKVYGSGASRPIASPLPRLVLVPSTPPSTLRTFSVCLWPGAKQCCSCDCQNGRFSCTVSDVNCQRSRVRVLRRRLRYVLHWYTTLAGFSIPTQHQRSPSSRDAIDFVVPPARNIMHACVSHPSL